MHIFLYCGYSYNEEINEANVAHHTLYRLWVFLAV